MISQQDIKKLDDNQLIEEYRNTSDKECIGELYCRYTHFVYGVCMKYLKDRDKSKDAVMQIFESLFEKLKIHDVKAFKYWLYSVAKNHCLMQLRSLSNNYKFDEEFKNHLPNYMESDEELHHRDKEMTLQELENAVKTLKDEQKTCIELFFLNEKTYKEVADMTGYTMKQVKSYIQNGKRNLSIILSKKNIILLIVTGFFSIH